MRAWTLHLPPAGLTLAPALIPERFTWVAALTGLLWLVGHRIWWAAGALLGLTLLAGALLPTAVAITAVAALHLLLGYHAQDLRRAALAMRGWTHAGVILAPNADAALTRALHAKPELVATWVKGALA